MIPIPKDRDSGLEYKIYKLKDNINVKYLEYLEYLEYLWNTV
jgi:hypothetical protein